MPIQTIADALQSVGGNISNVLKEEGLRRQQALEAQSLTNELQYKQGLLGLEAQKATAAGQLGLAKVGAEARQFDVKTGLDIRGLENQEATQRATQQYQGRMAGVAEQGNVLTGQRNVQIARHEGALEGIGRSNAAAAQTTAAATMLNVTQHGPLLTAQAHEAQARADTLIEAQRLDKELVPIEPEMAQIENVLRATYPPATVATIMGQGQTLFETRYGDAHTLKTDAAGNHLMERGRLRQTVKDIQENLKLTLREQPTLGDQQKAIEKQIEARQKDPNRVGTDPQIANMVTAEHLHLTQLSAATQLIAKNNLVRQQQAEQAALALKKGPFHPNPVLTEDERKTIQTKIAQLAIEDRFTAAEMLNSTQGHSHGVVPLGAPPAPPPAVVGPPGGGPAVAPPGVPPPAAPVTIPSPQAGVVPTAAPVIRTRAGDTYTPQTLLTPTLNKRGETVYQPSLFTGAVRTGATAPAAPVAPSAPGAGENPGRYGPLGQVASAAPAAPAPVSQYPPAELQVDAQFNTLLTPAEEQAFQQWKAQYAPQDSGMDYDLRGAFKAGLQPDAQSGHWPDTFKKPNHPTFSDQSRYAQFGAPGSWQGDTFVPARVEEGPLRQGYLGTAYQQQIRSEVTQQLLAQSPGGLQDGVHEVHLGDKRYRVLVEGQQVTGVVRQ